MEAKLRYCQACLCSDRNLYPVAKMYTIFQEISLGEVRKSVFEFFCNTHSACNKIQYVCLTQKC